MRTAIIAARGKRRERCCDAFQGRDDIIHTAHFCRITAGAGDDEIVIHHITSRRAVAVSNEAEFGFSVMHEYYVNITSSPEPKRSTRADGNDPNSDPGCQSKLG